MDSGLQVRTKSMKRQQLHEEEEDDDTVEPVSPTAQYFNSSAMSVSIIAVLESEIPVDDSSAFTLLRELFLPINPRFSSIMVVDEKGQGQWKRVDVKLEDHVRIPKFPDGLQSYDKYFNDYITKVAMDPLPQDQPLWEFHIIKYPTSNAAGGAIFKLHHALGDGYSLMGAFLSCLKRADDPSLPITFPSYQRKSQPESDTSLKFVSSVTRTLRLVYNSIFDFGSSLMKGSLMVDDTTPIRSGHKDVERHPVEISTVKFSLDQIKEIKDKLGVTINDVITGIIFLGTRLYMEEKGNKFRSSSSTALVLLNTRNIRDYKSVEDMLVVGTGSPWGNHVAWLHVSIPNSSDDESWNPLQFVFEAQKIIKSKRESLAVYLAGQFLETIRKYRGPESAAKYIHGTLKNTSMSITNIIGPVEKLQLANHPVKGLYFMVVGVPQSIVVTILSYVRTVRVAVGVEKGFIDSQKFNTYLQNAFDLIFKAANDTSL